MEAGLINVDDVDELWRADILILGREGRAADAREALLVVEVSRTVGENHIARAVKRAAIARTAGYTTYPVVGGLRIHPLDLQRAQLAGVEVYIDPDPDEA